jgi:hypothetical protein
VFAVVEGEMDERFPRRVRPENSRYLIHKVRCVWVDERGVLRFNYEDGSGKELLQGPWYPSSVNGRVPLAVEELAKSGLQSPDEVQYVIAYHCGAFPYGMPACLVQRLEDIPPRYLSPA